MTENNFHSLLEQKSASEALLKFCVEHERIEGSYIDSLRACINALEQNDINGAIEHYKAIPLGGMMCFNDWWPPCVFENETNNYVATVFEALTSHWSRTMRLCLPPIKCRACGNEIPSPQVCPTCYVHQRS